MIVNFKKCSLAVLKEMVCSFYDAEIDVTDESLNYKWSPAEVNQILFRNFGDAKAGIAELLRLEMPVEKVNE